MIWMQLYDPESGYCIYQNPNYVVDDFGNELYLENDQYERAEDFMLSDQEIYHEQ